MLTLPNLLTLARIGLVPFVAWHLLLRDFDMAFWLFVIAALTDLLDGALARLLDQRSAFGAWLDPVADKLMLLTTLFMLAWDGVLPAWLAVLVGVRDAVVVGGALAYRRLTGGLEVAPTRLGKLATMIEFVLVSLALAEAALALGLAGLLPPLVLAAGALAAASGLHYVWVWSDKTCAYLKGRPTRD